MIEANTKPRVNAFANVGIGYPNPLNFFDETVAPYAMAGVSVSYLLFDWGKVNRDKQILSIQSEMIDNEKETFEHQLNIQKSKYFQEVRNIESRIDHTEEIADLQKRILEQMQVQLDNGIITVTEYLLQSNTELQTRQKLKIYESQIEQVKVDFLTKWGLI